MRFHEIVGETETPVSEESLNETYVNLTSPEEKAQYADRVLELINIAYAGIGGNAKIQQASDLIQDSGMWKLVRRGGEIVFAAIFKDHAGRKRTAIGHDGSRSAKMEFFKIAAEDIKMKRAWGEVSGASAQVMLKLGVPVVPSKHAVEILGKEVLAFGEDGYSYTRMIGGKPHVKIIVGFPNGEEMGDIPDEAKTAELMQVIRI